MPLRVRCPRHRPRWGSAALRPPPPRRRGARPSGWLSVGIPYVLTFYAVLGVLEDTGYLNAATVLLDRVMRGLGLSGRAAIPLVAGAGCNGPAIIGMRTPRTERERLKIGTLITLVPCSARTAVIFGAVAFYLGWPWA